jgi:hypothetical protein
MVEQGWTRDELDDQDPADLALIVEALTVRRMAAAPAQAQAYAQIEDGEMAKVDLALDPFTVEEYRRRLLS